MLNYKFIHTPHTNENMNFFLNKELRAEVLVEIYPHRNTNYMINFTILTLDDDIGKALGPSILYNHKVIVRKLWTSDRIISYVSKNDYLEIIVAKGEDPEFKYLLKYEHIHKLFNIDVFKFKNNDWHNAKEQEYLLESEFLENIMLF